MHRPSLAACCCLVLAAIATAGPAQTIPRRPHDKTLAGRFATDTATARLVIKFHQGTGVRATDAGLTVATGYPQIINPYVPQMSRSQLLADLSAAVAVARKARSRFAPLVADSPTALASWQASGEASLHRELADLSLYFQISLGDGGKGLDLAALVADLNRLRAVEIAYLEPVASPFDGYATNPPPGPYSCSPANITLPAPNLEGDQGYLAAAPVGVDAFAAWTYAGGRGAGLRLVDVEGGHREHSDHPTLFQVVGQPVDDFREHSCQVVGVIAALDNGAGTTGIASEVSLGSRSIFNFNLFPTQQENWENSANAAHHLYWAAKHSLQGVVLVELQRVGPLDMSCPCGGACTATPVEYWPAEFDVIETATANGVVVVEAAANGGHNLDSPVFGGLFDRANRDSGAILVTGSQALTRVPQCFSGSPNSGSRVDVHSWGEDIVTTGFGTPGHRIHSDGLCNSYIDNFKGSSGASAIVAGVVASLQGAALANLGAKLDPFTLRQLLVDTGTTQAAGPHGELIGPQPNLAAALAELLP